MAVTFYDRIRYTLLHNQHGPLVITEPEGWKEDDKEFARNDDYDGIVTQFSNALRFVFDGADYIQFVKEVYGINSIIRLVKEVKNPTTNTWERVYQGNLDLATYEKKDNRIAVKFNSTGIERDLKARQSEKVEIERTETMDGVELPLLESKQILLEGRRIFLKSIFDVSESLNKASTSVESNAGNTRTDQVGFPLRVTTNSHQDILQTVVPESHSGTEGEGDLDMMLMFDMNRQRTFNINLSGTASLFCQQYENIQWAFYKIQAVIYENAFDFDVKERIDLYDLGSNHPWFGNEYDYAMPQFTKQASFSYNNPNLTLLEGESFAIIAYLKADMFVDNNAGIRLFAEQIVVDGTITENSEFPATTTSCVLAHEMAERITAIITNRKDIIYSEALGRTDIGYSEDGFASLTGYAHGLWIRNFSKFPQDEENKYKPMATSWKEFVESLDTIWGLNVGIETVGFGERIRIAPKSYFYQNSVTIKLPNQVKNVKRTISEKNYYSSIQLGYPKAGEYEEAMGLDEYNNVSNFSTVIVALKNVFTKITQMRPDSYGTEFCRRLQKSLFPTNDSRYDLDIFMFDLKRFVGDSLFKQRKWQDDFSEEPTGVFSPETATNLRWSPFNLLLRHGWDIASSFIQYPLDYVRFSSSQANSNLKTRLIGGNAYKENDKIINSELGRARYTPDIIEFEHAVDYDLLKIIEGNSVILGKEIKNLYGQIEFTNEDGEIERGYLLSLKPNKEGKWKLMKANR
jgi:hypothetical protein